MKYGELKIECLATIDELNDDITMDNLSIFEEDEAYKDLFLRLPGAINRAMDRIANRHKLPLCSKKLESPEYQGSFLVFDLSQISDYRNIKRVSYTSMFGYWPSIEFIVEGNTLMIDKNYADGTLRIVYFPISPAVSSTTLDTDELAIPDELARIIPYYVKSDLLSREEAELATLSRNMFESALDEINLGEEDSFGEIIDKKYRIE